MLLHQPNKSIFSIIHFSLIVLLLVCPFLCSACSPYRGDGQWVQDKPASTLPLDTSSYCAAAAVWQQSHVKPYGNTTCGSVDEQCMQAYYNHSGMVVGVDSQGSAACCPDYSSVGNCNCIGSSGIPNCFKSVCVAYTGNGTCVADQCNYGPTVKWVPASSSSSTLPLALGLSLGGAALILIILVIYVKYRRASSRASTSKGAVDTTVMLNGQKSGETW